MKKIQASECLTEEIFLVSGQLLVPIYNLFEEYMLLFDEPEKAINSEARAADNKIDSLKKIIDEAAKAMEIEPQQLTRKSTQSEPTASNDHPTINNPPKESSLLQGEGSSLLETTELPFQGENPSKTTTHEDISEGEIIEPDMGFSFPFEGENENANDEGDLSELEEEVNVEVDPAYEPNYPPLIKCTKDHPKTQIHCKSSAGVLTRSQPNAKQDALFSQVEFCMFNSFVSKIEPKTVHAALDHSDWVQAMQNKLYEFERNRVWRLIPTPKDASVVGLK